MTPEESAAEHARWLAMPKWSREDTSAGLSYLYAVSIGIDPKMLNSPFCGCLKCSPPPTPKQRKLRKQIKAARTRLERLERALREEKP